MSNLIDFMGGWEIPRSGRWPRRAALLRQHFGSAGASASLLLLLLVSLTACQPRPDAEPPREQTDLVWAASYSYVARDEQGLPLVQGELLLPGIRDGDAFAGTWQTRFVGADESARKDVGPQLGSGRLSGKRTGEEIRIELNPHMADNNVTLAGQIEPGGFSGRWEYITIIGVTNSGTFSARRE